MTDKINSLEGAIHFAEETVYDLCNPNLSHDKQIPISLLQNAKGIAFLRIIKAGLLWTGKLGVGLVIARLPDGRWSAPSSIGTAGIGFGIELGAEIINVMIILSSEQAVNLFHQKTQLTAGTNIELAAGPYGRSLSANAVFNTSGITPNYAYSQSKGIFGGIGIQSSAILARNDLNKKFYGRNITPNEILSGMVEQPAVAIGLYDAIEKALVEGELNSTRKSSFTMWPFRQGSNTTTDTETNYNRVIALVTNMSNVSLEEFKITCKKYGKDEITSQEFITYLQKNFTHEQLLHILPDLIILVNDNKKSSALKEFLSATKNNLPPNVRTDVNVNSPLF